MGAGVTLGVAPSCSICSCCTEEISLLHCMQQRKQWSTRCSENGPSLNFSLWHGSQRGFLEVSILLPIVLLDPHIGWDRKLPIVQCGDDGYYVWCIIMIPNYRHQSRQGQLDTWVHLITPGHRHQTADWRESSFCAVHHLQSCEL